LRPETDKKAAPITATTPTKSSPTKKIKKESPAKPKLQLNIGNNSSKQPQQNKLDNKQLLDAILRQDEATKKMESMAKKIKKTPPVQTTPRAASPDLVIMSVSPSTSSKVSTTSSASKVSSSGAKCHVIKNNGNSKAHENILTSKSTTLNSTTLNSTTPVLHSTTLRNPSTCPTR